MQAFCCSVPIFSTHYSACSSDFWYKWMLSASLFQFPACIPLPVPLFLGTDRCFQHFRSNFRPASPCLFLYFLVQIDAFGISVPISGSHHSACICQIPGTPHLRLPGPQPPDPAAIFRIPKQQFHFPSGKLSRQLIPLLFIRE